MKQLQSLLKVVFNMAININQLAAEISRQLTLYANQTEEKVDAIAKKVADDGVEELKRVSPKRSGNYAKSWTVKKVKGIYILHNKKHYRLTHLLEKSHAKVNGGRTQAQPHIKPTEQKMKRNFEDELRRGLSR